MTPTKQSTRPPATLSGVCRIALVLVFLIAAPAAALDVKPIVGSYAIGSATLVDPPPNEKKDRLLLYLDGATAREMYDTMTAPARVSACDPDLRTKTAGALECSRSKADDYTCSVGVSLIQGTTVKASVC